MNEIILKQNDTAPPLIATLTDAAGEPIDLTGSTVKFRILNKDKTDKSLAEGVIVNPATDGVAQYNWQASDNAEIGVFWMDIKITSNGNVMSVPNDSYIKLTVRK